MKRQATGIVLCALLLTTFGHELLNRHQVAQSARQAHNPLLSRAQSRHNDQDTEKCSIKCVWERDLNVSTHLDIHINASAGLVAVVNVTAEVALVVDANSSLVGLFYASSNSVIIVDIERSIGVSFSGGWSSSQSFNLYFESLASLKVLYQEGKQNGTSFTSSNITVAVSDQISLALKVLSSGGYSVEGKEALTLLVTISKSLTVSWKVLLVIVETVSLRTNINLKQLVVVLDGLVTLIGQLKGGVSILVNRHFKLNLEVIFDAETSVDVLLFVLLQLSSSGINLTEVLGAGAFNSSESFFGLLAKLGGNSTQGFNGFISVVYEIVTVVNGHSSVQALIVALIQFYGSSSRSHNLAKQWQQSIENLIKVINQLRLNKTLQNLVKLLHDIQEEKWTENNINISAIIKILIENNDSSIPIDQIVRILALIVKAVAIEVSISVLLLELIRLLTTEVGLATIGILIPNIKIDSSSSNILSEIVRGTRITDLLSGNPARFLRRLPIIGDIYVSISRPLKVYYHVEIDVVLQRSSVRTFLGQIREILMAAIKRSITSGSTSSTSSSGGNSENTTSTTESSEESSSTETTGDQEGNSSVSVNGGSVGGGQSSGNGGASEGNNGGISGGGDGNIGGSGGATGGENGGSSGNASGGVSIEHQASWHWTRPHFGFHDKNQNEEKNHKHEVKQRQKA